MLRAPTPSRVQLAGTQLVQAHPVRAQRSSTHASPARRADRRRHRARATVPARHEHDAADATVHGSPPRPSRPLRSRLSRGCRDARRANQRRPRCRSPAACSELARPRVRRARLAAVLEPTERRAHERRRRPRQRHDDAARQRRRRDRPRGVAVIAARAARLPVCRSSRRAAGARGLFARGAQRAQLCCACGCRGAADRGAPLSPERLDGAAACDAARGARRGRRSRPAGATVATSFSDPAWNDRAPARVHRALRRRQRGWRRQPFHGRRRGHCSGCASDRRRSQPTPSKRLIAS